MPERVGIARALASDPAVLELWQRVGFRDELGTDHVFSTKRNAIATTFDWLDPGVCANCTVRVFEECKALPLPAA